MDKIEERTIAQLKNGDNSGYKYLYSHYYALLCKVAYGFLHDTYLAETIVGDVFFHIYEIRDTININTTLRGYLIMAVRNRCINFLKLEYQKREASFGTITERDDWAMELADKNKTPLGELLQNELEDVVLKAIEQLPKESRQVFKLSRLENLTYKEISDRLGISVNTVKYHIKNALALLSELLDQYLIPL